MTGLILASDMGELAIVMALVQAGADVTMYNNVS
jgi:hypothetical protein